MLKKVVSCQLSVVRVIIIFLFTVYLLPLASCFAKAISSTELINNAKQYDGRQVVYEGEVIQDVMLRGDHAWINVNDSLNALGIWIKAPLAKEIIYTGSYKSKGDWVEVTGIFNRACPEHGGDLDIHAQGLRKISPGRFVQERLNPAKKDQALILLGILGVAWILTLLKRK